MKKIKHYYVATIILILVLTISFLLVLNFNLKQAVVEDAFVALNETGLQQNNVLKNKLDTRIDSLNIIASSLALEQNNKDKILAILNALVNNSKYERVIVCNIDGIGYTNSDEAVDISRFESFKKAKNGEQAVFAPEFDSILDDYTISIAVPIFINGQVEGVLCGRYRLEVADSYFLESTYNGQGYGEVIIPSGEVIISTDNKNRLSDETNIFVFFNKANLEPYTVNELIERVGNGESISFEYTYNNEHRYANMMPVGINDWYIVSIVPSDVIDAQVKKIVTIMIIVWIIFVCLLLVIGYFIYTFKKKLDTDIEVANSRLRHILFNVDEGISTSRYENGQLYATYLHNNFRKLTGYSLKDIYDLYDGKILNIFNKSDIENFEKEIKNIFPNVKNEKYKYSGAYRITCKNGEIKWLLNHGVCFRNSKEQIITEDFYIDITYLKNQEEKLRIGEERFKTAIEMSNCAVFEYDFTDGCKVNAFNLEKIFGNTTDEYMQKYLCDKQNWYEMAKIIYDKDYIQYAIDMFNNNSIINGSCVFQAKVLKFDGTPMWCEIFHKVIFDCEGKPIRMIVFMQDIDKQKTFEIQAKTDLLTGLYNKKSAIILIDQILSLNNDSEHILLVIDLDNFKLVNDNFGHVKGDEVISLYAQKIKDNFRDKDIVSRFGGDEFVVFMPNVKSNDYLEEKFKALVNDCYQILHNDDTTIKVTCSIGVSLYEKGDDFNSMFNKADKAMYSMKKHGKNGFNIYTKID